MGRMLVLISAVLYGFSNILIKVAYSYGASLLTVLTLRHTIAAVLLWMGIALLRVPLNVPRSMILPVTAIGMTLVPLQSFAFFLALSYLPASSVSVLLYTYPLHVAWMGWLFLREPIRRDETFILCGVVLGSMLVAGQTPMIVEGPGLAALSVATLANAFYYVVARRMMRDVRPLHALALLSVGTAVVFGLVTVVVGGFSHPLSLPALLAILGTAVLASLLAPLLLLVGLRTLPAARAAMLGSVEPVITVIFSVLMLGDRMTFLRGVGIAAVILGIGLVQLRRSPLPIGASFE